MEGLRPPPQFDVEASNLPQAWRQWKEEFNLYTDLAMADKDDKTKVKMFMYLMGSKGRELYQTIKPTTETLASVLKVFEDHCNPPRNETVDRYKFFTRNQEGGESFDAYVTELKILAANCNFAALRDSLIRDRIICGIIDPVLRERLLRESDLTLESCVKICRAAELSKMRMTEIEGHTVHAVNHGAKHGASANASTSANASSSTRSRQTNGQSGKTASFRRRIGQCLFCGYEHELTRDKCPAYGKQCARCGKKNHFQKQCKVRMNPRVHQMEEIDEFIDDQAETPYELKTVELISEEINTVRSSTQSIFAKMSVQNKVIRFQLDCGATCNVLPLKDIDLKAVHLQPTNRLLSMYNKTTMKPVGQCTLQVINPKTHENYDVPFIVVNQEDVTPILGTSTIQQMGLIEVHQEKILKVTLTHAFGTAQQLTNEFEDVFDGVGKLAGKYKIELDDTVPPVVHPPRRIPLAMKEKLKEELDKMVEEEIIAPVDTPTSWVSSLVCVDKPNKLRICLDPQDLNKAIRRNHYPMKTIEDILPELNKAKVFSVVDAKHGFWHVELDDDSSYLTTFNTPHGRYRWRRMPFGISSAPEEFQRRLDDALEGLRGVKTIADDILVYGEGETHQEAERDHDENLRALMTRCREKQVKLNRQKLKFKQTEVSFMGHLITKDGLKPDPAKVKAVNEMPSPTDVAGVRRFLGFVNYLSKFLPHLSEMCEPLRQLTKKDIEWCWLDTHEKAVASIKTAVTAEPVLRYFDERKKLMLQADASEGGLGAAIMQDGQPIAYASRALLDAERRYAQIEKELLAVTFGLERFHQYTYGRQVTVQTDHKPLEVIVKKNMHQAPKRLQRLILRLQNYETHVVYHPGSKMYIADTLSRAYLPSEEMDDDHMELEQVNLLSHLPISMPLTEKLKQSTADDPTLQELHAVVTTGWPEKQQDLPANLTPYFHIRDELSIAEGLIFKGERVVIPKNMRKSMLERLHSSHIGETGCLRRARESLYWPGMNAAVKDYIQKCEVCRSMSTKQQKEPIRQHEIPNRPWAKVGADLFTLDANNYLVIVDYFSNYIEIDYLSSTTSSAVIHKMKAQFARHGIPDELVTDNGPQFTAGDFKKFVTDWEFHHTTSSPHYPQSNGKVENAVKTAKSLLKKAKDGRSDPYLSLLAFRNTPSSGFDSSPVQRLMNRRTKTRLPTTAALLKPQVPAGVDDQMRKTKQQQAFYYNRTAKVMPELQPGDVVRIQPQFRNQRWQRATVLESIPNQPRSYRVQTEHGVIYRRNRRHLRRTPETTRNLDLEIDTTAASAGHQGCQGNEAAQQTQHPPQGGRRTTRSGRTVRLPAYLKDYVEK